MHDLAHHLPHQRGIPLDRVGLTQGGSVAGDGALRDLHDLGGLDQRVALERQVLDAPPTVLGRHALAGGLPVLQAADQLDDGSGVSRVIVRNVGQFPGWVVVQRQ